MIALRLVERHVLGVDAADDEALAEAGGDASGVAVARILDAIAVRVLASSAVHRKYQVVAGGGSRQQQEEEDGGERKEELHVEKKVEIRWFSFADTAAANSN